MTVVHASYYTDPACAWSWSIEPVVRRLAVKFGASLHFTYVMAGIREIPDGTEFLEEWLDVSAESGMPVDPRFWLKDAAKSSYPAGMAVKAAAEQGDPGPFLRRLREGFAFRGTRLDHLEAFMEVARGVDGLDLDRFRIDAGSHAIVEAFGADLDRSKDVPEEEKNPAHGRVRLPSIVFRGEDGSEAAVWGPQEYATYQEAAVAVGGVAEGGDALGVEDALRRFGSMATVEVAAVCDLPGPRASAELWRLASEWRVRSERVLTGELWTPA